MKEKKRLLFHVCCGPCSIALFEELKEQFDEVVAYFYNPNIHPEEEYERRKKEVELLCEEAGVSFVEGPYDSENWFALTKDLKEEREGGSRCGLCFDMRVKRAVEYAREHGFDTVATSITSGRNKRADVINPIGLTHAMEQGLVFLEADWKKGGRQEKGIAMGKEKGVYRQDYCGCVYSRIAREKQKNNDS
ncbi:MAG: epoxyqueuosine reductase QueH [Candidatus Magasanikbacteria bacterium]|jgi:epoxyqueuosine reductase|nr:epoxyqueuosine reductase QueH [Candidatus Magasanikbacteria bacterium]MBT4071890.1 epoxyqueuosine reductase QueH [Candidatus Magasanikbacteria bacterium]